MTTGSDKITETERKRKLSLHGFLGLAEAQIPIDSRLSSCLELQRGI